MRFSITFFLFILIVPPTRGANSDLENALRCALQMVNSASTEGALPEHAEAADILRRQLEALFRIDFIAPPRGDELHTLLVNLGQGKLNSGSTAVWLGDRYNVLGRLTAMSRKLFPNNDRAELFTVRAAVSYGIAAFQSDAQSTESQRLLLAASADRPEKSDNGQLSYSIAKEDFAYLGDVARVHLNNRRGGTLMVRSLIHALADTLEIPSDAK